MFRWIGENYYWFFPVLAIVLGLIKWLWPSPRRKQTESQKLVVEVHTPQPAPAIGGARAAPYYAGSI